MKPQLLLLAEIYIVLHSIKQIRKYIYREKQNQNDMNHISRIYAKNRTWESSLYRQYIHILKRSLSI